MSQEKDKLDAGLRSLNHYKLRLPKWRYYLREKLLPIVRWETPYVAWLQSSMRSPFFDSYFAMSANLGTHTFFMIMLPILFWCGETRLARGMVNILALGVYLSGFAKDLLCLPRPLSPPLQRITMSGSAALEYGFPSTHSTNAVSAAMYAIFLLRTGSSAGSTFSYVLQGVAVFYAVSIVLGRLYCGMHGFFDVIWGTLLGAAIAVAQCVYGDTFDTWLLTDNLKPLVIVLLVVCVAVRIHPEPADDCPCFDDSVAFSGTLMGIHAGGWHFAQTGFSSSDPMPSTVAFSLEELGWTIATVRIIVGVLIIFAWRGTMKPTLLNVLPPIFRVVEHYGMTLPRRFFMPASQYGAVPDQRDDDNVIPAVNRIPSLIGNLRRRRAISIGPQSEADAYEALAYRESKRRSSMNLPTVKASPPSTPEPKKALPATFQNGTPVKQNRRRASSLEKFEAQMGMSAEASNNEVAVSSPTEDDNFLEQIEAKLMFSHVHKPRVRYDVEVITKLIVYSGIAWLAVEGNPIIFELLGLGLGQITITLGA